MSTRTALLGVLGLALALAIGVGANVVSNDSVGLSAAPLRSVDSLAPEQAERPAPDAAARRPRAARRARARKRKAAPARPSRTTPAALLLHPL